MYLSGSIKDLKNILVMAEELKAKAIHFIAPNRVFILAKNKEDYIFVKTGLVIGYSIMMPQSSYANLLTYLKAPKKGFDNQNSIFYQKKLTSVVMTVGEILYDGSSPVLMEIEIPSYPLKKEVEIKLDETMTPAYERNAPYLKFASEDLEKLHKQREKFKKTGSSDISIRIEDDQLVLYSSEARVETDIRRFSANRQETFSLSDKLLYFMDWLNYISYAEEVVLLPREHYCVFEGYHGEMTIKVRTKLVLTEKGL